jgi:hypothetical protein
MNYESLYIEKVSPMIELNELLLDEVADTEKHGQAPFALATALGALMRDIIDEVDPPRKK